MRLTTKGRFAVTALLDIGIRHGSGPVSLADISKRQKISLSYLEQLFSKLRQRKLVNSVRGPGGGYCLAKELDEVSVADIILAVDEPLDNTQCGGKGNCLGDSKCMTHDLWVKLNEVIFNYLGSVTLQKLVDEQNQRELEDQHAMVKLYDMREAAF